MCEENGRLLFAAVSHGIGAVLLFRVWSRLENTLFNCCVNSAWIGVWLETEQKISELVILLLMLGVGTYKLLEKKGRKGPV